MGIRAALVLLLLLLLNVVQCRVRRDNDDGTELPLRFEVPLPHECTVSGTMAHTYNQGLCSRKPCRTMEGECAESNQCCFEVGQTANVDFTCSDSSSPNHGHVIVMCHCQPCSQLHAEVKGTVLSSFQGKPVVLAAVVVGSEIVTFTNQDGSFSFETLTSTNELTLVFHEFRHRQLETTIQVHPSLVHELNILLEYIEIIDPQQKMEAGFDTALVSNDTKELYGIDGFLHIPPTAFIHRDRDETYQGPGKVLHSLYCTNKWPGFSVPALDHMVYVDSRGAEFSIQAIVIGSLDIMGEGGEQLQLQIGAPIVVTVSLRMDVTVDPSRLGFLHLFSYSEEQSRWLDHGRVNVIHDTSNTDSAAPFYWATLQGRLRQIQPLWIVGYPLRLSCWVKSQVFQSGIHQEEVRGVKMRLQQSDRHIGRGSFYQHALPTQPGVGACLKSVCSLGGILTPHSNSGESFEAVTPSIVNGIIMGNREKIMIYAIEKQHIGINGRYPFYPSEGSCLQHSGPRSGHFRFVTKSPNYYQTHPTIMLTASLDQTLNEFCYLKVAILDCAAYSDVKVFSYGQKGEILSVNFEIASILGGDKAPKDTCSSKGVPQLKASCVDFTCGSSVHVSAQSRLQHQQTKFCRYWSSTSSLSWTIPPSHNLTSFYFTDQGTKYEHGHGIYRSISKEVALMKCYSGSQTEPSNIMDPYKGAAVTFTCLN